MLREEIKATEEFKTYLNSILHKIDDKIHNELWDYLSQVILQKEQLFTLIIQERQAKAELLEALKNLLYDDAMPYYSLFPNSHRQTKEEYFKAEIDLISKHETKEEG